MGCIVECAEGFGGTYAARRRWRVSQAEANPQRDVLSAVTWNCICSDLEQRFDPARQVEAEVEEPQAAASFMAIAS